MTYLEEKCGNPTPQIDCAMARILRHFDGTSEIAAVRFCVKIHELGCHPNGKMHAGGGRGRLSLCQMNLNVTDD